jgi:chaperone required for assembly of F1-ATPase
MQRFYREVAVERAASGFSVQLDGKALRTPGKAELHLPSPTLADAVAAEWREQGEKVLPGRMPLTQIAVTAIDITKPNPKAVIESILRYTATDLVCYRAGNPASLALRQARAWQPLLDWLEAGYGIELAVTHGVVPQPQSPQALAQIAELIAGFDPFRLTALLVAVEAAGSCVIGLALALGRIDAKAASEAAELEGDYQAEHWGTDPDAVRRREAIVADMATAATFLSLLSRAA